MNTRSNGHLQSYPLSQAAAAPAFQLLGARHSGGSSEFSLPLPPTIPSIHKPTPHSHHRQQQPVLATLISFWVTVPISACAFLQFSINTEPAQQLCLLVSPPPIYTQNPAMIFQARLHCVPQGPLQSGPPPVTFLPSSPFLPVLASLVLLTHTQNASTPGSLHMNGPLPPCFKPLLRYHLLGETFLDILFKAEISTLTFLVSQVNTYLCNPRWF